MAGKHLTPEEMKQIEKTKDFIEYALANNERRYNLKKIAFSTFSNDDHAVDMFRDYIENKTGEIAFPMDELSPEVFEDYKKYCL